MTTTAASSVTSRAIRDGIDLKSLRLTRGLKAKHVAERLRVSPQAYAGFELSCQAGTLSVGRFQEILRILDLRLEVKGPTQSATVVTAPAEQGATWDLPEHYVALPCDFDADETLKAWSTSPDLSDPPPTEEVIENMRGGLTGAFKKPPSGSTLFTVDYACRLHRRMFGEVSKAAGTIKPKWQFPGGAYCLTTSRLSDALAAAAAGLASGKPPEEVANELHLTLAADAAFAQGSAAHARAMADLVLVRSGIERFTWGLRLGLDAAERTELYRSAFRCRYRMPQLAKEALAFARA